MSIRNAEDYHIDEFIENRNKLLCDFHFDLFISAEYRFTLYVIFVLFLSIALVIQIRGIKLKKRICSNSFIGLSFLLVLAAFLNCVMSIFLFYKRNISDVSVKLVSDLTKRLKIINGIITSIDSLKIDTMLFSTKGSLNRTGVMLEIILDFFKRLSSTNIIKNELGLSENTSKKIADMISSLTLRTGNIKETVVTFSKKYNDFWGDMVDKIIFVNKMVITIKNVSRYIQKNLLFYMWNLFMIQYGPLIFIVYQFTLHKNNKERTHRTTKKVLMAVFIIFFVLMVVAKSIILVFNKSFCASLADLKTDFGSAKCFLRNKDNFLTYQSYEESEKALLKKYTMVNKVYDSCLVNSGSLLELVFDKKTMSSTKVKDLVDLGIQTLNELKSSLHKSKLMRTDVKDYFILQVLKNVSKILSVLDDKLPVVMSRKMLEDLFSCSALHDVYNDMVYSLCNQIWVYLLVNTVLDILIIFGAFLTLLLQW